MRFCIADYTTFVDKMDPVRVIDRFQEINKIPQSTLRDISVSL